MTTANHHEPLDMSHISDLMELAAQAFAQEHHQRSTALLTMAGVSTQIETLKMLARIHVGQSEILAALTSSDQSEDRP